MSALRPANAALNLSKEKYSHGLQRRVAVEVSKGSFEDAVESIDRTTGGHVPKRQAEEIARRTASDFETFYEERKGPAPSACRHLVKDRMDVPGEWSLDGAEAVLRLRALRCSGDFDEYWLHHENAELRRNHLSAYANGDAPDPWPGPSAGGNRRGHLSVVK